MPWTKFLAGNQNFPSESQEESDGLRKISHAEAIREALDQALSHDERVFIMGQGVDDPGGLFGATLNLHKKHGSNRVFDTPLSENALTGVAIGSALAGMRPFYCHNRPDFLLITMDQIVNHASKWSYMFGGTTKVPLVIWAVTARGWGSAAQHSQALQGLFMHIPGLKLVMPATPYDAKGLIVSSIADDNPVIILEHRWLFKQKGYVPEELYSVPLGKGVIRRQGSDVTIVAISHMTVEALRAAEKLAGLGVSVEVIDLRTLKPLDEEIILSSIKKTGHLVIADTGWKTGGVSAEIAAVVVEKGFDSLKKPVKRVACKDVPTPASYVLEEEFYPDADDLVSAVLELTQ
ncbi:MAG: alpha-ketoacid dehydrogenase subunit beta [Desulfitobacteriaceae bacterium]